MKYEKPLVVAVAAAEAIRGVKGIPVFPDSNTQDLRPTQAAYEADE